MGALITALPYFRDIVERNLQIIAQCLYRRQPSLATTAAGCC
jgi:hypothetical protein